jgi:hypothetical protein
LGPGLVLVKTGLKREEEEDGAERDPIYIYPTARWALLNREMGILY